MSTLIFVYLPMLLTTGSAFHTSGSDCQWSSGWWVCGPGVGCSWWTRGSEATETPENLSAPRPSCLPSIFQTPCTESKSTTRRNSSLCLQWKWGQSVEKLNFDANTPFKLPAVYTLKIQQKEDKEERCMKFNSPIFLCALIMPGLWPMHALSALKWKEIYRAERQNGGLKKGRRLVRKQN